MADIIGVKFRNGGKVYYFFLMMEYTQLTTAFITVGDLIIEDVLQCDFELFPVFIHDSTFE